MADNPNDSGDKTQAAGESTPVESKSEQNEQRSEGSNNGAVRPEWSREGNDIVRDARNQPAGTDKLPGVNIQTEGDGNRKVTDSSSSSAMSWATKGDLNSALRYLESIRSSAEAELRAPAKSGGDRAQYNVYQLLNEKVLPALQKEIGPDWKLFPSKPQSPADKVGADFLLVNTKTGEFHFVDATTNTDKRNIFDLRARGVIQIAEKDADPRLTGNSLFDQFGSLKVDDENLEKREAAKALGEKVTKQIRELIKEGTPFRLGKDGTPMPSVEVKSDEQTKAEIERLGNWAQEQGRGKESRIAELWNDMKEVVMRSFKHTEFKQAEVKSPELAKSVSRLAEQEVLKLALAKVKNESYNPPAEVRDQKSDVYTMRSEGLPLRLRTNDGLFDGGKLLDHIANARLALLNDKKILNGLSNKELQSLGVDTTPLMDGKKELKGEDRVAAIDKALKDTRYKGKFEAAAAKIRTVLMQPEVRGSIENGGSIGKGPPLIVENVIAKLRTRTADSSLGIVAQPPKDAPQSSERIALNDNADQRSGGAVTGEAVSELMKLRDSLKSLDPKAANDGTAFDMRLLLEDQVEKQQKGQDSWSQPEIDRFKALTEAYEDPKNPKHEEAVKQVNEAINAECERRILIMGARGTANFAKLTDKSALSAALQELSERTAQRLPAADKDRGEFLQAQIRSSLRKQLGIATDRDLPEALRNLKVQIVAGDAAPRVVQDLNSKHPVLEISSAQLKANASRTLVDAYSAAAGLTLINTAGEKGNLPVTMRSLEPMINDITQKARNIAFEQAQRSDDSSKKPAAVSAEAAASDRRPVIDTSKPIVTAWDGENLTFGGEKFHMNTEIEKAARETAERVQKLEGDLQKAKEQALAEKTTEARQLALRLQTQLDAERQNLTVISELRESVSGQRGAAAQDKARGLIKTAADKVVNDHLNNRRSGGSGSGGLSRAAAAALVITTITSMLVSPKESSAAEVYQGQFK